MGWRGRLAVNKLQGGRWFAQVEIPSAVAVASNFQPGDGIRGHQSSGRIRLLKDTSSRLRFPPINRKRRRAHLIKCACDTVQLPKIKLSTQEVTLVSLPNEIVLYLPDALRLPVAPHAREVASSLPEIMSKEEEGEVAFPAKPSWEDEADPIVILKAMAKRANKNIAPAKIGDIVNILAAREYEIQVINPRLFRINGEMYNAAAATELANLIMEEEGGPCLVLVSGHG